MGILEMITFLHDLGFSASIEGSLGSAISSASLMGHKDIIWTLISCGEDVNFSGKKGPPRHEAILKILLEEGAFVNQQGQPWGCALQAAAYGGFLGIVKLLLNKRADMFQKRRYCDAFYAASKVDITALLTR